ncbi:MAG TPA: D-glycerate dehydrogenase [Actinomycetota bacterium]|nr:D-glycerate dehydrogenase [Actinomycetota bacterium]
MNDRPRVVVTRRLPKPVEDELSRLFDARLNTDDRALTTEELREAVATADALLPTVTDKISAEVLGAGPRRVRIVANFGVGYNNIDVEAAKAAGIAVTNTPGALTDCTADLAMTLLLSAARRAGEGERHLREGSWTGWRPTHMLGTKVTGKTLGIIGLGRIGRAVARRAHHGFGMKILYYNRTPVPADQIEDLDAELCTLEQLLARSDFVSLHCPSTPDTRHLLNAETLALMKPGAFLINSARGDVVDESALVDALKSGTIAGAGLDVYDGEPAVRPELATMENVVLLPHLGSATTETRVAMGMRAVANLKAFFNGDPPPDRVA